MIKATWKDVVIAQSDQTILIEGSHYFPPEAVRREYLQPSSTKTMCPWKGIASFYNLVIDEEIHRDAAWYYPQPGPAAQSIQGYIAFWGGVKIETE